MHFLRFHEFIIKLRSLDCRNDQPPRFPCILHFHAFTTKPRSLSASIAAMINLHCSPHKIKKKKRDSRDLLMRLVNPHHKVLGSKLSFWIKKGNSKFITTFPLFSPFYHEDATTKEPKSLTGANTFLDLQFHQSETASLQNTTQPPWNLFLQPYNTLNHQAMSHQKIIAGGHRSLISPPLHSP